MHLRMVSIIGLLSVTGHVCEHDLTMAVTLFLNAEIELVAESLAAGAQIQQARSAITTVVAASAASTPTVLAMPPRPLYPEGDHVRSTRCYGAVTDVSGE